MYLKIKRYGTKGIGMIKLKQAVSAERQAPVLPGHYDDGRLIVNITSSNVDGSTRCN